MGAQQVVDEVRPQRVHRRLRDVVLAEVQGGRGGGRTGGRRARGHAGEGQQSQGRNRRRRRARMGDLRGEPLMASAYPDSTDLSLLRRTTIVRAGRRVLSVPGGPHVDVLQEPDGDHAGEHRRPAVGDERQR